MLKDLLSKAAKKAISDGFTHDMIDDHPGGNVHSWCRKNVNYNDNQEFYVVFLVAGAIADELAIRDGYESQADRAAKIAMSKFRNVQTVAGLPPKWERIAE